MSTSPGVRYWLDGRLLDEPMVSIHPESPLLQAGEGWFETLRVQAGVALGLEAHLARLRGSARAGGIEPQALDAALDRALSAVSQSLLNCDCARLRIALWPSDAVGSPPRVLVSLGPYPIPSEAYRYGLSAITSTLKHPGLGALGKSLSYHWSRRARLEARALGADEALLANDQGLIEASTASLVWSEGGQWYSTSGEGGSLASVTVGRLRLAGLSIAPRAYVAPDVVRAEGLMLVSALRLVVSVRFLDGHALPDRCHMAAQWRERLLAGA
jgi:branched-subunit amino acid aminotransferase/4-amino-4-deoxychorismate lyase